MHLTRSETQRNLPIPRKGTKYVARALGYVNQGIPVVLALRDILKTARTTSEVKLMISNKSLKINGRLVRDHREPIKLFNIFEAGEKVYELGILPTGRFSFSEVSKKERLCKIIGKKVLSGKKIQINTHDGSNFISNQKITIGDSVIIDGKGEVKKIISLEKGKKAFVFSGKRIGKEGVIESLESNKIQIKFDDGLVELDQRHVVVRE